MSETLKARTQLQCNNKQKKVLSKSLLFAGLGFGLTCLIGFFIVYFVNTGTITMNGLYGLSSASLIGTIVVSMVYMFKKEMSQGFLLGMFALFTLFEGIGFGSLFLIFNRGELLFIFGSTGLILLITGMIGYNLSDKAAFSIAKILMILVPIFFITQLIFIFVSMFAFSSSLSTANIFLTVGMSAIVLLSNILSFYQIAKTETFVSLNSDADVPLVVPLQLGFMIYINIINTIWTVARWLMILRN